MQAEDQSTSCSSRLRLFLTSEATAVDVFLCVFGSLSKFLAKSDEYMYKLADNVLDALTNGEHSKGLKEAEPVSASCGPSN